MYKNNFTKDWFFLPWWGCSPNRNTKTQPCKAKTLLAYARYKHHPLYTKNKND